MDRTSIFESSTLPLHNHGVYVVVYPIYLYPFFFTGKKRVISCMVNVSLDVTYADRFNDPIYNLLNICYCEEKISFSHIFFL